MFTLIVVLLVIWLIVIVLGFAFHTLVWLAIIGIVLFVATAAIGWVRRKAVNK